MTYLNWDLTDLYTGIDAPELLADLQNLVASAKTFARKFDGKVDSLSAEQIAEAIVEYEQISELSQKLATYAYLQFSVAMLDEKISKFYQIFYKKLLILCMLLA